MLAIGIEETEKMAQTLAKLAFPGDCITLQGDLGAGKTVFVQTMLREWGGGDMAVISPTFNILQTYDIAYFDKPVTVWHYDLYRLESEDEIAEIGLEEAFANGITLIEWPELALAWLPKNRIEVIIEFSEANDNRDITIHPPANRRDIFTEAGLC